MTGYLVVRLAQPQTLSRRRPQSRLQREVSFHRGRTAKKGNWKTKFEAGEALLARILTERRQNWQGRGSFVEPGALDLHLLSKLP